MEPLDTEDDTAPTPLDNDQTPDDKPTDDNKKPTPTPMPDEPKVDDETYATGLWFADHETGMSYSRFADREDGSNPIHQSAHTPRANPADTEDMGEHRGRDRLRRVVPEKFTYGAYRSRTREQPSRIR